MGCFLLGSELGVYACVFFLLKGKHNGLDLVSMLEVNKVRGFTGGRDWAQRAHMCSWNGLTCSPNQTHVLGINLSSSELSGSISHELWHLTSLEIWSMLFPRAPVCDLGHDLIIHASFSPATHSKYQ